MKPPWSLLVTCAISFVLSACHNGNSARRDHPRTFPGVTVSDTSFHSAALGRNMPYRVYLPANLAADQKLPVVYLLHGGDGGFRDWSNDSDVGSYAARGLILIMPEGAFSYYMNAVEKPQDRFEDYIVTDLISDVEARFPVAKGREHRAVIGISMGGFAAIEYALARPELFSFVAAFSPSIDILHRRFNIRRTGEWWRIRTIFGPWDSQSRQQRDPFVLVNSADPARTPFLYIGAGDREPLRDPITRFTGLLRQRRFAHQFYIMAGGHDWGEWDTQIPVCFESLRMHMLLAQH